MKTLMFIGLFTTIATLLTIGYYFADKYHEVTLIREREYEKSYNFIYNMI